MHCTDYVYYSFQHCQIGLRGKTALLFLYSPHKRCVKVKAEFEGGKCVWRVDLTRTMKAKKINVFHLWASKQRRMPCGCISTDLEDLEDCTPLHNNLDHEFQRFP